MVAPHMEYALPAITESKARQIEVGWEAGLAGLGMCHYAESVHGLSRFLSGTTSVQE